MISVIERKANLLFIVLGGFFVANALIAEFIGIKIFSLEKTFGFDPVSWKFFGIENLSFQLTAGVLLWPVIFVMTDVINEYYGRRGVKILSFLTVGLIIYAFVMFALGINLIPADWWPRSNVDNGVPDMQVAFTQVFGQGMWIIIGSVVAFLVAQLIDVFIFHRIKLITGERLVWLRATGSTVVSQLVDSFVVLFIAFNIGQGWEMNLVLAICLMNYIYKFLMAILLTPVIYLIRWLIQKYLGKEEATRLKDLALTKA